MANSWGKISILGLLITITTLIFSFTFLSISILDMVIILCILFYFPVFTSFIDNNDFLEMLSKFRVIPLYLLTAGSFVIALWFGINSLFIPWFLFTALMSVISLIWLRIQTTTDSLLFSIAHVFLTAGAAWQLITKIEMDNSLIIPFQSLAQLTAIHFYYAGYALTMLLFLFTRYINNYNKPSDKQPYYSFTLLISVPLLAIGIAFDPLIEFIAVLLLVGSLCIFLLHMGLFFTFNEHRGSAPWLLLICSVSGISGVLFGLVYGVSAYYALNWYPIEDMILTHGMLNALGFVGSGVLGWYLLLRE